MRIFCDMALQCTTAGTVWVAYDSPPTCAVYDMLGTLVEAGLASAISADEPNAYVTDTTDALYAHETLYRPRWTVTLSGTTYTVDGSPYEHYVPGGAIPDTTPPAAPEISEPSAGEQSATVVVTPPGDSDYLSTTVYAIPVLGGTTQSATGTSGVLSITGLVPGTLYAFVAVARDTSGNLSVVSNAKISTTLPATDIERPAYLKWFVNDEVDYHEHGPEVFDPSETGSRRFFNLGRGRTWSFLLECHEPVWSGTRGIGGTMTVPRGYPAGLRDDKGT